MKKKTYNKDFELGQQIAELRGVVVTGFEGVHARQDVTNGRIGKAEGRLEKLEEKQIYQSGARKGIGTAWQILLSILGLVLGALAIYYGIHH